MQSMIPTATASSPAAHAPSARRRPLRRILHLVFALVAGTATPVAAESPAPAAATATPAPGFVADLLWDFAGPSQRLLQLAEAMPADKFGWRPAQGVRSFSQILMHVAAGNYFAAGGLGVPPPSGLDPMKLEEVTDKEQVVAILRQSIDAFEGAVAVVAETALAGDVELFDDKMSRRRLILFAQRHFHEHAGQAIAYARMNGVTPPWSRGAEGD
jgi:uncharacterized damage-inducible protein DinB